MMVAVTSFDAVIVSRAQNGDTGAMFVLGLFCIEKNNKADAIHWLQKAANMGHCDAKHYLGCLYTELRDWDAAIWWYKNCAHMGSLYCLAKIYERIKKNKAAAIYWYQKAAEMGNQKAVDRLAEQ